jgi:putative serine protease PepD
MSLPDPVDVREQRSDQASARIVDEPPIDPARSMDDSSIHTRSRDEAPTGTRTTDDASLTPRPPIAAIAPARSANAPRRGFAAFVLLASLASGLAGGIIGAALQQPQPAAAPAPAAATPEVREVATATATTDIAAAANAVIPAVVTVVNRSGSSLGTGSGVVIDKAMGYIVTNSHVVEQARSTRASSDITVLLADGRSMPARVIGNDPSTDVAVLQVAGPLPAEAALSKGATIPVGSPVIAIGTPGTQTASLANALTNTVTSGIVSATGRRIPREDVRGVTLTDLIQTDASIGPGMSGGPLVLVSTKQVIGLTTLLVRGEADLGFAISSATVARVAEELIARGASGG